MTNKAYQIESEQEDYRVFYYWNNGLKYKFIGQKFIVSYPIGNSDEESFTPLLSLSDKSKELNINSPFFRELLNETNKIFGDKLK